MSLSTVDPAFNNAGKKPGLEIWRIENLAPVPVAEASYGIFFSGDSYLVLNTKTNGNRYEYDIHFWLGEESSADERGAAAFKTIELDEGLKGRSAQHREVQSHESDLFLSYFRNTGGVRYQEGGVASGFNTVSKTFNARLLHLKGKRNVRVSQVPLTCASLSDGDVFVLDAGDTIYQWNGKKANKMEKAKGLDLVTKIRDEERGSRANIVILESGEDSNPAFWDLLGGKGKIAEADDSDEVYERSNVSTLYRVSDASGSLQIEEVGKSPLKQEMLDTNDCFILDSVSEIYVWVGKGATQQEKAQSWSLATEFLSRYNRPDWTPITKLTENLESTLFKSKFAAWKNQGQKTLSQDFSSSFRKSNNTAAVKEQKATDASTMLQKKQVREQQFGSGEGKIEVWYIKDFQKVPLPEQDYGIFYSGDCYIILYTYTLNNRTEWVIYFWLGRNSTTDEKGAAAALATKLDDSLGGRPVQVRLEQGREPDHFLRLFKGKFLVLTGGVASGFQNLNESTQLYDSNATSLFHVKGSNEIRTCTYQIDLKASNLNSGDSFVLQTPSVMYVWYGSGSNLDERDVALNVAKNLNNKSENQKQIQEIVEGEEPEEFWNYLGGKAEYTTATDNAEWTFDPRLFVCSNASGSFVTEEIHNFSQEDLCNDDIALLDTYSELFVWIGKGSNETERSLAMETAKNYADLCSNEQHRSKPIVRVESGNEPPIFTSNFIGWNSEASKQYEDPYLAKLKALKLEGTVLQSEVVQVNANESIPYSVLKVEPGKPVPQGIDLSCREKYLSDAEFQTVFKMTKDQFYAQPEWKKMNLKKQLGLF